MKNMANRRLQNDDCKTTGVASQVEANAAFGPRTRPTCGLPFAMCVLRFPSQCLHPRSWFYARRDACRDHDHRVVGRRHAGAVAKTREVARADATKATIAKLNDLVMRKYESYLTRRLPLNVASANLAPQAYAATPHAGPSRPDADGNARTLVRRDHRAVVLIWGLSIATTGAATDLSGEICQSGELWDEVACCRPPAGQVSLSLGDGRYPRGQVDVQWQRDCRCRRRWLEVFH